jgi:hypothetical protein
LLKLGLLKADLDIKLDVCMALTNMALNGLITEEIIPLIVVKSHEDKPKVCRELSYYLVNMANIATFHQLGLFLENGLVYSLKKYLTDEGRHQKMNAFLIVQTILKRLRDVNNE